MKFNDVTPRSELKIIHLHFAPSSTILISSFVNP